MSHTPDRFENPAPVWEIVEVNDEPQQSVPTECPTGGWASHEWRLTIEEGVVGLATDCTFCAGSISPSDDFLYTNVTLVGRPVFEPDHPGLGGWHGLERCDCGGQIRFEVERMDPS